MNERKLNKFYEEIRTTLGAETAFNGVMKYNESLKISGRFEGRIESGGLLVVDKGAEVLAEIKVKSVVIAGTVKGNVEAAGQLEILDTGKVIGNIRTAKLKMADGVVFEGKVEMLRSPDSVDIFSATPDQLKRSLESV